MLLVFGHITSRVSVHSAGKGKKDAGPQAPKILEIPVVPSKKGFELPAKQPATRTAYRRPSSKDKVASIKAAKKIEYQEQLRRLASPGPKVVPKKPPVMLIDAYNCLFHDTNLVEWLYKEPDFARGELEKRVAAYADAANIKCQLIYDAMRARSRSEGTFRQVSKRVVAVFVSRSEADTYLVKKAWSYKEKGASEVVVVSSDNQVLIGVTDEDYQITTRASDEFMDVIFRCSKGITSGIKKFASLPGTADMSWYARQSSVLTSKGRSMQAAQPTAAAKDLAEAAPELEDMLEGILYKHGAPLALKDLCDGDDNEADCLISDSEYDDKQGPEEGASSQQDSLDLESLDDLLGKCIV
uniref:NYN domain-containing protein n=2 Tax=Dunaliella tertiolecta TaxID=3047 RepID=A0A7S3R5C6_DUNTE|mmetsp:Transcript_7843/g.20889  ORF Transcript_7843/g.20889 Transcript_7843/m.20889 type:complete len:355 (+) Transcript_7843:1147-2211(+)|eukprot:CAMPEP_0202346318 /NCGR_PEP_ID=MMETSP1126-20121109/5158_1 /ASSEMBLY_ACC=CAM_ASM_000457 /TAXON_ID=3047 /ORGANISM="Dunaliella tertiolecta, Strain CCMP1320" /LENGTH=354 /DNA_ID=CAMNT_0048937705 /DNA_START=124 /DNA_END=1188 /DNA_ORIENTATION=-